MIFSPTNPFSSADPRSTIHCKGPKPIPAAPTAPPVTERQVEVRQAERSTKLLQRKKKGMLSTILAGESSQPQNPMVGTKSILGPGG